MSLDIGALRDLVRAIAGGFAHERRESSHRATVTRVDPDGKVWVSIPGTDEDTPVRTSFSSVSPGDVVSVEISHGSATITGNVSSPSVGGRQVSEAIAPVESMAIDATDEAHRAYEAAESATESAIEAATAAALAQTSATAAGTAAASAQASATSARTAANTALTQLSVVQDVAGTLEWIQDHGSYVHTQDQSIQDGKVYFVYDQTTQDYVSVVNPTAADLASYYELDLSDSQAQYVMAHLSVTERGLWVQPGLVKEYFVTEDTSVVQGKTYYIESISLGYPPTYHALDPLEIIGENPHEMGYYEYDYNGSTGYKVLLASDGLHVYNDQGTDIAHYGETARIGDFYGYHIEVGTTGISFCYQGPWVYAKVDKHSIYMENDDATKRMSAGPSLISVYEDDGSKAASLLSSKLELVKEGSGNRPGEISDLTANGLEFFEGTTQNPGNAVAGFYPDHIDTGDINATGDADIDGLLTLGDDMERHADISVQIGQDAVASATKLAAANLFDTDQFKAFYFEVDKNASDALFNSYVLRRKSADGTATIAHGFYLWIDANEKQRVTFPDGAAAAWREGMGGLRKVAIFTGKSTTAGNVIGTSTDMLKYEFYLVRFSSWNRVCICHRSGSYLHGTGGRDTGSAAYHLAVTMDVNTTTGATTVTGASETLLSSTITRTNLTVTDIYGLC